MRKNRNKLGFFLGAALVLSAQPLQAAQTEVTDIEVNSQGNHLELQLETEGKEQQEPQFLSVIRGNTLVTDILNTELSLPAGKSFRRKNPMPGIAAIEVSENEFNGIKVVIEGKNNSPVGEVTTLNGDDLLLKITPNRRKQSVKSPKLTAQVPAEESKETEAEAEVEAPSPQPIVPASTPDVLVPNPTITIDGQPIPATGVIQPVAPAPAFLPRAVPPPVGDIAVGNINAAPEFIDLGTNVIVPRLVLREAPVREVLALLARNAGLNLVYTGSENDEPEGVETTISLDLENESVQDAFNTILQVSGLQANRRGRTIFVGPQLPIAATNVISRSLRLNQVQASSAAIFLATQGASVRILQQEEEQIVDPVTQRVVRTVLQPPRIQELTPDAPEPGLDSPLLLRGLSVSSEERTNVVTMVGEPRKVEVATSMLTQIDIRKRQVAVNIKIVDIDLAGAQNFNTSFSFGVGDTFFSVDQGRLNINQGRLQPPTSIDVEGSRISPAVVPNPLSGQQVFLEDALTPDEDGLLPTRPDTLSATDAEDTIAPTPVPNTFLDINGVPRQLQELQGFGGTIQPATNISTAGFVAAPADPTTGAPQFFDVNGIPRLASEFIGLGGTLQPLLQFTGTGNLIQATTDVLTSERTFEVPNFLQFPREFLGRLQAEVISGNAKILTDPTLVIQEDQEATVRLTENAITSIDTDIDAESGVRTVTPVIEEVGLILNIAVEGIDDNGFITLSASPTVSALGNAQEFDSGAGSENVINLITRRELSTGLIRMRDGQTLLLSGIIQESERETVTKVPFLGDLPILGSLFRDTSRTNARAEVIILVTPQIMDDSPESAFGYTYTPGRQTQEFLRNRGFNVPAPPR